MESTKSVIDESLTEIQKKAVKHNKGPALVIAGPGSGKTLVLTERVKYLIEQKGVEPESIMVTTFTEKAANELKARLSKNLQRKAAKIQISTIHSLCKTLLEDYFTEHSMGIGFNVIDTEAQRLLLRTNKFGLGIFRRKGNSFRWLKNKQIEDFLEFYDFMTRNDIDPEKLKEDLLQREELSEDNENIIKSYQKYMMLLDEEHKIDFANLQLKFYKLINGNARILKEIRDRFEYLLVDEYQDTSPLQDRIFRLLSPPQDNIFVVGDRNQSIYGFRGASALNFENFTKHYPDAKVYLLNENFRSTQNIVELSNTLMRERIKEELKARRRRGEKSVLLEADTADAVAKSTVKLIEEMKGKGLIDKYGDVALLFRCWHHTEDYIKYLEESEIPYIVFGGGGLIEREEISAVIYLISYVTQKVYLGDRFQNWSWWNIDCFKKEVVGLSPQTNFALEHLRADANIFDYKTKEQLQEVGIESKNDIEKILELNKLREQVFETPKDYSLLKIFYRILEITGYLKTLLKTKSKESEEKLQNLARLSEIIAIHEGIPKSKIEDFLWFIYTSSDEFEEKKIEDEDTVKLMTVHKAKGLEFPVVFLCSLNEGRFPLDFRQESLIVPISKKFYMSSEEYEKRQEAHYEEERRLFYVGLTRAQDNLILTTSRKIKVQEKGRSRFIKEIEKYLEVERDPELPIEKKYKIAAEIPILNYSAINTYIDCPFRYKLLYKYGFVAPPSFLQNLGVFVHNVLQRIHREMQDGTKIDEKKIQQLVDEYWIPVYRKKKEDKKLKSDYLKKVKEYYANAAKIYDDIIAIEEPFIHIDERLVINGKVDLIAKDVDGKINLIDFKAREAKGIEHTNVDKQLKMYNYCIAGEFSIDRLAAYTFLDNKMTVFKPEKKATKEFLEEMSKEIKAEKYEKKTGVFCKECTFRFCC